MLFAHGDFDELDFLIILDQSGFTNIVASFLVDFTDGTVEILLVLVDFSTGKAPVGALLPAFDEDDLIHLTIQHDSSTNRHPGLVGQELGERCHVVILRPICHERTVLKDSQGERLKGERRQGRIERPDKILVEPLCLLNLEAYPLNRFQFFTRQVYNEADAQVI
jgi:hypothetical protein